MEQIIDKPRMEWADQSKFAAIFLVVMGHTIQHLTPESYADNQIYRFIYSFHMPLFMMISGFFSSSIVRQPWKVILRKRFTQLIIPIIAPSIIISLIAYYRGGYLLGYHFDNIPLFGITSFWFVKTLFISIIAYTVTYKLGGGRDFAIWMLTPLLMLLPHSWMFIDIMYPCFLCGTLLNRYYDWFKSHLRILIPLSSVIFIVLLTLRPEIISGATTISYKNFLSNTLTEVTIHYMAKVWTLFTGLIGAVTWICIFLAFEKRISDTWIGKQMSCYGRLTLGVYNSRNIPS